MIAAGSDARVIAIGPARRPARAAAAPRGRTVAWWSGHRALWQRVERGIRMRLRRDGCDVVHLTDARLAPCGAWLRGRLGLPVTVDLGPQDLHAQEADGRALFAAADQLDAAFVFGCEGEAALERRTTRVPMVRLPLVALAPSAPDPRTAARLHDLLGDGDPRRPVIAFAGAASMAECHWFEEDVLHAMDDAACWLRIGDDSAAHASHGDGVPSCCGALDDGTIAALARYADAFVLPWALGGAAPEADGLLRLALAASGVPVIAGDAGAAVLDHERNAFLVRAGDALGFRATIDQLLRLPAKQRQYIGEEFAAETLRRWPAAEAAAVYEERFAALAGRPTIPAELRIA